VYLRWIVQAWTRWTSVSLLIFGFLKSLSVYYCQCSLQVPRKFQRSSGTWGETTHIFFRNQSQHSQETPIGNSTSLVDDSPELVL
jgi:hypothetical protein